MKNAIAYPEIWYSVQCPNCSNIVLLGRTIKTHVHKCTICDEEYGVIAPKSSEG